VCHPSNSTKSFGHVSEISPKQNFSTLRTCRVFSAAMHGTAPAAPQLSMKGMSIKRNSARQLIPLIVVMLVYVASVTAQVIIPSGKTIGKDKQGNSIYQVHANGIDIGYKLIGKGEPLVMIMGLGGTMERWPREVTDALSTKYQMIIPDNRGMGYSTVNDTTFTTKLLADDIIALLDALGVRKANVLGYSLGSTITQELLLGYSQRFNKAVIYAPSTDGSKVAKVLDGKKPDDPVILRYIEATSHWKTPMDKLPGITNQVMIIIGTSDTTVGVDSSKAMASAIPGAWLVQFKNATHPLMLETPIEFARIVLAFLDINETVDVKK
jgi:pimeloyl-ACP methyl ester carboxylesterase